MLYTCSSLLVHVSTNKPFCKVLLFFSSLFYREITLKRV